MCQGPVLGLFHPLSLNLRSFKRDSLILINKKCFVTTPHFFRQPHECGFLATRKPQLLSRTLLKRRPSQRPKNHVYKLFTKEGCWKNLPGGSKGCCLEVFLVLKGFQKAFLCNPWSSMFIDSKPANQQTANRGQKPTSTKGPHPLHSDAHGDLPASFSKHWMLVVLLIREGLHSSPSCYCFWWHKLAFSG